MLLFIHRLLINLYTPVLWTALTITLLCLPGSAIPDLGDFSFEFLDKIVHFFLFGTLVFLWYYYLVHRSGEQKNLGRQVFWITLGSIALGICLEIVQYYFIPYRSFDPLDIVANSLGAVVIAIVATRFVRRSL